MTIGIGLGMASGSSYDAAAQSFFTLHAADGGTLNAATKSALNSWFIASAAYRSKILRLGAFLNDAASLSGALVPLVRSGGNAKDTSTGFVAGDLTSAGLKGDGAAKYLDTGLNPYTAGYTAANLGLFAWLAGVVVFTDDNCLLGTYGATGSRGDLSMKNAAAPSSLMGSFITGPAGGGRYLPISNALTEFVGGSGQGAGLAKVYLSGSPILSASPSPTVWTGSTGSISVFAFNNIGTIGRFYPGRLSCYVITNGMSDAEILSLYTHLNTLMTALGRI